jgi:transcriptional regulator with XRE-family HTH domain
MDDWWTGAETIAELITRLRTEQGKSQYALADALRNATRRADGAPDRGMVHRWETGRRIPTPYWRTHLASVLGVPVETLDRAAATAKARRATQQAGSHVGSDAVIDPARAARHATVPDVPPPAAWRQTIAEAERDMAQLWLYELDEHGTPAGAAATVTSAVRSWLIAPPDSIAAQTGKTDVSPNDVNLVRAVRTRLKDLDNAHGGGVAFPLAAAYLRGEVSALLHRSCDEEMKTALLAAIAEAELDTGWYAYDAGDHQLARAYLLHALRLAHAARSRLLSARIVCALSHQALHVGQVGLSVDLAHAARVGAGTTATPRAAAMLAAMEAMTYAAAGDAGRCGQALGDAERALASATADDGDPGWLDFDEGGLLGHTARAMRDLAAAGRTAPDHAMQAALRSVGLSRSGHSRTRLQRNAILATTCVQAGDIGHAAAVGEQIITDAWNMRSRHVEGDIAALLASIEPAGSRSASEFTGLAREFLAARRPPAR